MNIKLKYFVGVCIGAMPEYEDCKALAAERNVPVRVVWEAGLSAAQEFVCE